MTWQRLQQQLPGQLPAQGRAQAIGRLEQQPPRRLPARMRVPLPMQTESCMHTHSHITMLVNELHALLRVYSLASRWKLDVNTHVKQYETWTMQNKHTLRLYPG